MLIGEIVGVPLGYLFILILGNQPIFRLILGVSLIGFAVNGLLRPRFRQKLSLFFGSVAGLIGGFLTGAFTMGGPPLALFLYSRYQNPVDAKATLQIMILMACIYRLFNIFMFGEGITPNILKIGAISLLFVMVFSGIGHLSSRRIPKELFVKIIYLFICFAGIMSVIRGLM
jgi:uncharacterized membrane protein YfcA